MATIVELTAADAAAEAAAAAAVRAFLLDRFPELVVDGGPAADLIVSPSAAALAAVRAEAAALDLSLEDRLRAGEDPSSLSEELAAAGVDMTAEGTAAGTATLSLEFDVSAVLLPGTALTASDGTVFYPDNVYQFITTTATPTGAGGEVQLVERGTRFVGEFGVVAAEAGTSGNKPAGASLTVPTDFSPTTAVVYLSTSTTGGADTDSTEVALSRLADASEPGTTASEAGVRNLVRAATVGSVDVRVVGFAHASLRRGLAGTGVVMPGRVDVYLRVPGDLDLVYDEVTATLVANVGGIGQWQFTAAVSGAGFPEAAFQLDAEGEGTGYPVTFTSRGYADAGDHDVTSGADGAGSAYATVTGRFLDPDTPIGLLVIGTSTRDYTVSVRRAAGVGDSQESFDEDEHSSAGVDVLARGPTPIMVSATITVRYPAGETVDTLAVKEAFAASVNSTGISGRFFGTAAAAAAVLAAPAGSTIVVTAVSGVLYGWAATPVALVGTDAMSVTTDVDNGVADDTVAFYCDAEDVTVNLVVQ